MVILVEKQYNITKPGWLFARVPAIPVSMIQFEGGFINGKRISSAHL